MKSNQEQGVWVVIPAAGVGSRMQSTTPKQYLSILNKSVLEHTVSRFLGLSCVVGILIVVSETDAFWTQIEQQLTDKCQEHDVLLLSTFGGNERSDTVTKGLTFLLNEVQLAPSQWVMVHDAARPCVRREDIFKLLAVRNDITEGGAILATPVRDTLKRAGHGGNTILRTQPREALWQAQTPQLFCLSQLREVLLKAEEAGVTITDEASAMELSGMSVMLVEGSSDNIKLTTPSDLSMVEFIISNIEQHNGS